MVLLRPATYSSVRSGQLHITAEMALSVKAAEIGEKYGVQVVKYFEHLYTFLASGKTTITFHDCNIGQLNIPKACNGIISHSITPLMIIHV